MPLTDRSPALAILGAPPAFAEPLHVGRPNLGSRAALLERLNDMLDRNWLTNNGPLVQEFENRLAGQLNAKHCVAMCNGTVALEIAIRALEMTGEVIVPSFTFVATAHALKWQQITPVFCDIDRETHHLDPAAVERAITERTTGIIGVHLWGRPCDIERLETIARTHNLKLLFDASHALACSYGGRMIGSFGDAEVFSFHATKFIHAAEGGAVVTNNDELAGKIRLMRNFGFMGYDRVEYIGTNGKMNELSAAMGLTSLDSLETFREVNRRNLRCYAEALRNIPGLRLLAYPDDEASNYQYIVIEVDPRQAGLTRDRLIDVLHAENVLARRYFYPGCHNMEPYRSLDPQAGLTLPVTEQVAARVLVLPTGTSVDEPAIRKIADILRAACARAAELAGGSPRG